jgi:membrane-associated HD superfamily phosphohydrolase
MSSALIFLDICRISFFIGYGLITAFFIIQLKEKDKVARPFMISLILLFISELIGNSMIYSFNRITGFGTMVESTDPISNLMSIGYLLVLIGPMYLIFNLEKKMFKKPIVKEKHLMTFLHIIFISLLVVIISVFLAIKQPYPYEIVFVLLVGVLFVQGLFFLASFIYLSIKSTGIYRRNSTLVALGYTLRLGTSGITAILSYQLAQNLFQGSMDTAYMLFAFIALFFFIGLIVMAYGLLKLYSK